MPVLISDDAHDPSNLFDEDTKEAYKIVNDIGLEIINKIDQQRFIRCFFINCLYNKISDDLRGVFKSFGGKLIS